MPHDAIFFFVGIIFAIPLSIAANLATPRVRDWVSSFSRSRLEKRIAELKDVLANEPPVIEWMFAEVAISVCNVLLGLSVPIFMLAAIVLVVGIFPHVTSADVLEMLRSTLVKFANVLGILASMYLVFFHSIRATLISANPLKGRDKYLAGVKNRLSALEQKLSDFPARSK